MTIKPLNGHAVLCEDPGCDKPAVYLFTQSSPMQIFALCDAHGLRHAERLRLALPREMPPPGGRTAEAIA